jgi:hypothetical protein
MAEAVGSVLPDFSSWKACTEPEIDSGARSSGLRVCTLTVPPTPPSSMSAIGLLKTSTLPTISDGSIR